MQVHPALYKRPYRFAKIGGAKFDGSNDYLTRGADLTGSADGKNFSCAFRIRRGATTVAQEELFYGVAASSALRFLIDMGVDDHDIRIFGRNSAGTTILNENTTGDQFNDTNWHNVLIACNMAADLIMYVDDVAMTMTSVTFTDDNLDLTLVNWAVGATDAGVNPINADIQSFWFNNEYIDFSTEANRRLFFDAKGHPQWLGSTGTKPTGNQPLVYLSDTFNKFERNRGSGGDFTVTGELGPVV